MNNTYYVATYATSPSFNQWNPQIESQYFKQLAAQQEIIGIEHPFLLQSDKYNLEWLKDNLPSHWSIIVTALPVFMILSKDNPSLGLASSHEHERIMAVKIMEKIANYTKKLNHLFERRIVNAVHLHAFPRNDNTAVRGNKVALKQSLHDLKNIDFDGAALNIEHCDSYRSEHAPEKGFLSLEDEIEIIHATGGYGIILNWGRSAIEHRSTMGPLSHINMAKQANLLKGFFFSGCTSSPQSDYGAWKDTHMPPKNFTNSPYLSADSLLGQDEIKNVFSLLEKEHYLGVKVLDTSLNKTLDRSVGLNISTIHALEKGNEQLK
ncbi:MAG: hypothetical protein A3F46_04130 [Legionellales bacterium RIFCSPHIGHO2_12_FULL_42_9]|nr:MAG: hypothetical protein A3F46_04130 [Legionellales bacterium RIFCSPHIGHO2_12_FULL_42_9]